MRHGALLKWPLVLALAGHAGVFALLQPQGRVAAGSPEGAKSMQLRLLPAGEPPAPVGLAAPESSIAPVAPSRAGMPSVMAAASSVTSTQAASAPDQAAGLQTSREAEGELVGYLPRNMLTRAPKPLGPVDVPFPPEIKGRVNLKIRLTLFIDELGAVRYVRIDTEDVPAAFADATRKTFLSARFSPAQLKEASVRAQIRAEVVFETDSEGKP